MSSHVRFVVQIGGSSFGGSTAKKYLKEASGWPVKSMQEAIKAANYLGARLWVFREPRKLSTSKSRYKKFCCLLGIGRAKKKYKPPQGAHHAGWVAGHPPTPTMPTPQPITFAELQNNYITFNTHFGVVQTTAQGGQNGPNQPGLATPTIGSDDLFS